MHRKIAFLVHWPSGLRAPVCWPWKTHENHCQIDPAFFSRAPINLLAWCKA